MVCEAPRPVRSLLVKRRGQFFHDPFFRDAWDDYNSAVRRIVDRFNHGFVSPSSRIRDSQYHSMYRTLRTARLNYSAHSARFKDEGNNYKLVMDVHEFEGGDVTVRTAGNTVSVRGKVEGAFDDTASIASEGSSSSRSLHRRFTLPVEADCEKIESCLSKDAVLTVTIPKKEVHYIPVTLEDSSNENLLQSGNSSNRFGGAVKRPNESKTESNRKKIQDDLGNFEEKSHAQPRKSRYDCHYGAESRKRSYEELKNPLVRSRRTDKYEDIREINIPVDIVSKNNKAMRPSSLHELRIREPENERPKSFIDQCTQHLNNAKLPKTDSSSTSIQNTDSDIGSRGPTEKKNVSNNTSSIAPSNDNMDKKRIVQPENSEEKENINTLNESNQLSKKDIEEPKSVYKPLDMSSLYTVPDEKYEKLMKKDPSIKNPLFDEIKQKVQEADVLLIQEPEDFSDLKGESPNYLHRDSSKKEETKQPNNLSINGFSSSNTLLVDGPKIKTPPPSPGGREVKVEKQQSCLEEDIFKDCWRDFSNTLQEVLNRLQELSSELGQSKIVTAPLLTSSKQDESTELSEGYKEEKISETKRKAEQRERQQKQCLKTNDKQTTDHSPPSLSYDTKTVIGPPSQNIDTIGAPLVGEGNNPSLHFPLPTADAHSEVENILMKNRHCDTQSPLNGALNESTKERVVHGCLFEGRGGPAPPRPNSLNLFPGKSLLPELRKNSPVEALHERFLRENKTSPSVERYHKLASPIELTPRNDRGSVVSFNDPRTDQEDIVTASEGLSFNRPQSIERTGRIDTTASNSPPSSNDELERKANGEAANTDISSLNSAEVDSDTSESDIVKQEDICEFSDKINVNDDNSNHANFSFNDLNNSNVNQEDTNVIKKLYNFPPNVSEKISPDSNDLTLKTKKKGAKISERCTESAFRLSSPPKGKSRQQSHLKDTSTSSGASDVTEYVNDTRITKIPSNDVMGAEHLHEAASVGRGRVVDTSIASNPAKATDTSRRSPPKHRSHQQYVSHQHSRRSASPFTGEDKGHADRSHRTTAPRREMGSVISRGIRAKTPPESPPLSPVAKSPCNSQSRVNTQHYPFRTASRSRERKVPEHTIPSYVTQQSSDPTRRYSGFGHVKSNNVKRMRDAWNTKQDSSQESNSVPPSPSSKVPPASPVSRRSPGLDSRFQYRRPSPQRPQPATENTRPTPFRKRSPSPVTISHRRAPSPSKSRVNPVNAPLKEQQQSRIQSPSNPGRSSRETRSFSKRGGGAKCPGTPTTPSPPPSPAKKEAKENIFSGSPAAGRRRESSRGSPATRPESMPARLHTNVPLKEDFREKKERKSKDDDSLSASKTHQKIFKRFRNANLQPNSEAVCFKEEEERYKMVMDVEEFVPGEIEVLQDDKMLTVKGRVEGKDSAGHVTAKSFNRIFAIPRNSREEDIDSALSEDGILTIFVPKKKERVIKIELID